jgi:hypothetical protein
MGNSSGHCPAEDFFNDSKYTGKKIDKKDYAKLKDFCIQNRRRYLQSIQLTRD